MELIVTKYKQTEVGFIPIDWNVIRLGDYITLKNGYAFKSEFFSSNGPIVMTPGNFKLDGGLKFNEKNTIRFSGEYLKHMCFENGDLIMVMTDLTPDCNLLGKSGIIDSDEIILHNQRIGKIEIHKKELLKEYLNIYFNSFLFSNRMKSTATGSTVRHTSVPTINNSKIILPASLEEQKAIAQVLSDTDALIQALEKKIAKKKLIKKGVMQRLLTHPNKGGKRLSGYHSDWEEDILESIIIRFSTGLNPRQNFTLNSGGSNFYITIKDISKGKLYLSEKCDLIDDEAMEKINSRSDLRVNDILFSSIGRIGDTYLIKKKPTNWNINESVFTLRPNSNVVDPRYISILLSSDPIKNQLKNNSSGSTFTSIKQGDLRRLKISFPRDKKEQAEIAKIISDIVIEIEVLEQKLSKYQLAKQGMMQQLLTGKIRLV